jgi:hypothetical protein
MWEILADKAVQMQLLALLFIIIGVLVAYILWKELGKPEPEHPTAKGLLKKLCIGIFAWVGYIYTVGPAIAGIGHEVLIFIAFSIGLNAELIGGGYIQQWIEKKVDKFRASPKEEVSDKKDVESDED